MKILFITRKYPPHIGGMETFSAGFVQALGSSVTVRALRRSQVHLLWWYPITLVWAVVMARRYDLIHFGDGVLAAMAAVVTRLSSRPVTITLHGLDVTYRRWPYQPVLRWSLRSVQHCICVSRATAEAVAQRGVMTKRISVIPNGIALEHWPVKARVEQNNAAKSQPKQILSVGRLVPRKGIAWFLTEVLPQLTMPLHYHVVGSGPEGERLQQLVNQLQLTERVTLHGQVDESTLHALYLQADAFIMPNVPVPGNPEGFGIVAIEAAACGVPVLAAKLEGIADAVVDGDTGFLLESRSVLDWITCLQQVLTAAPLAPEHIRAVVAERFSWQAVGQQYSNLFNHLIVSSHVKR